MADTPNHGYNRPDKGDTDWHTQLNKNFNALDTAVEIRDTSGNRANYNPKNGAKFLETDTGQIYFGDGASWNPGLQFGSSAGRYLAENSGALDFTAPAEWENNGATSTNTASGTASTVAGGSSNRAKNTHATVGGGRSNLAGGQRATISGGNSNEASSKTSTVGGGNSNLADDSSATVSGGDSNIASGRESTVGGGTYNKASGNAATVPGGELAQAVNANSFVWNDGTGYHATSDHLADVLSSAETVADDDSDPTGPNTFSVGATGGVRFITGNNQVTFLDDASAGWTSTSSRAVKTNIHPVEPEQALDGVQSMEIATWEYEGEDGDGAGMTHIGPMAEDFHDAFDVGSSEKHINSINADGAAFAAIQGLSEEVDNTQEELEDTRGKLQETREELESIKTELDAKNQCVDTLQAENERLRDRLVAVEEAVDSETDQASE